MSSTTSPVSDEYMSIKGVPKYMTYVFEWNWLAILFFIYAAYTVPCIIVFLKIAFFYLNNRCSIRKSGLRVEIFQAFILMQLFGILFIISEFFLFRVPFTTMVTSYCAKENPQVLLRFISFFYYAMCYSSQLLTAFFCACRVAILYSASEKKTRIAVIIIPLVIIAIAASVASPHLFSYGLCIQMFGNFPFGSIFVISVFSYFNAITVELQDMLFVTVTCLVIVILNIFTFRKLRRTRSLTNLKSASQTANIEKTLTRTMVILLVPLLVHFLIATLILFQVFHAAPALVSHLVIVRDVFLDVRVHTATIYFYWTHPIFRSQKKAENMSTTSSPVPDEYMSIKGVPKYMNYVYEWNWLTIMFFIQVAYTVPCIFVFLKIVFFYLKNRSEIRKSGLRVEIFQTFILMQLFGVLWIISEFLLFRIPMTAMVTSYCASENPQVFLRFISFFHSSMCYSSQLLTAFFCGLRVAILYSVHQKRTKLAVFIVPSIIVIIAISISLPHILSYGMCMQMFGNFPFGSIVVISVFSYFNMIILEIEDMTVITITCFSIIISNFLTFKKLRKTRSLNNVKSATHANNVERTLTRTMVILLVPLLVHFLIDAGILFQVFSFAPTLLAHIMLLRPWFLDLRVHTVTLYFYWTHPIFRNRKQLVKVSSSQNIKI